MRAFAICLLATAAMTAGCLRATAFKCETNNDCGAGGVCEPIGYCSVANASCQGTGRSYSNSAGQDLSNTCVPGSEPGPDAGVGIDAPIDGTMSVGCPSPYAAIAGSPHRYKTLTNVSWDQAKTMCKLTSTAAYLAVPDDAAELANLATIASTPFWVGIDDQATPGTFVTTKGDPFSATSPLWAPGEPNTTGGKDCVDAVSTTTIATEKCGTRHDAVCECEP
ncbi:MAG TPA: C-type lectin domain-containing protein [Kofleriaceae bacterium]